MADDAKVVKQDRIETVNLAVCKDLQVECFLVAKFHRSARTETERENRLDVTRSLTLRKDRLLRRLLANCGRGRVRLGQTPREAEKMDEPERERTLDYNALVPVLV